MIVRFDSFGDERFKKLIGVNLIASPSCDYIGRTDKSAVFIESDELILKGGLDGINKKTYLFVNNRFGDRYQEVVFNE